LDCGAASALKFINPTMRGKNLFDLRETSFRANLENPKLVKEAYKASAKAGVHVLATNTIGIPSYSEKNYDPNMIGDSCKASAKLAREVATHLSTRSRKVRVAACLPIYHQNQSFLEYEKTFINPMLPYVDIWYLQDIDKSEDAYITADVCSSVSVKPIWLSYSLSEAQEKDAEPIIQSGERLGHAVTEVLKRIPNIGAIMSSSSSHQIQEKALETIRKRIPLGLPIQVGSILQDHSLARVIEDSTERVDVARDFVETADLWRSWGAEIVSAGSRLTPDVLEIATGRKAVRSTTKIINRVR